MLLKINRNDQMHLKTQLLIVCDTNWRLKSNKTTVKVKTNWQGISNSGIKSSMHLRHQINVGGYQPQQG